MVISGSYIVAVLLLGGVGCNNEKRRGAEKRRKWKSVLSGWSNWERCGLWLPKRLHVNVIWAITASKDWERKRGGFFFSFSFALFRERNEAHGKAHAKKGFWRVAFEHVTKEGQCSSMKIVQPCPTHSPPLSMDLILIGTLPVLSSSFGNDFDFTYWNVLLCLS